MRSDIHRIALLGVVSGCLACTGSSTNDNETDPITDPGDNTSTHGVGTLFARANRPRESGSGPDPSDTGGNRSSARSASISGEVLAPVGASVDRTAVIARVSSGDECDPGRSESFVITEHGETHYRD